MQYILSYKSLEGIKLFCTKLKEIGYEIYTGLDAPESISNKVIGICVDLDNKVVYQLNVTCMACFSNGKRKPLYVEETIKYFDRLILDKDYEYYEKLIKEKSLDKDRPFGVVL